MTYTARTLTWTASDDAEKIKEPGAEENTANENIRQLLSVFDSLNKLCEKLSRLDYVIKRKIMETELNQERKGGRI